MNKELKVYDGYCVYEISGNQKAKFIVNRGEDKLGDFAVPLFRIVNGIARSSNWNGDTSNDSQNWKPGEYSDYECLQQNVESTKDAFKEYRNGKTTTIVVTKPETGEYGVAVIQGIVVGLVKE